MLTRLILGTTILLPISAHAQTYSDAGTDYTATSTEYWTENFTNEFIRNVESFGCLIENSLPSHERNVNANYIALLDEVACGLRDVEDIPGAANNPIYSKTVLSSSRAEGSPQEIQLWFDSSMGQHYIANGVLESSSTAVPPYGEWYMSFYKSREIGGTDQAFDINNSDTGFVKVDFDGTDLNIYYGDRYSWNGNPGSLQSKLTYLGNNPNNVRFLGLNTDNNNDTIYAGQSDANSFYAAAIDGAGNVISGSGMCFDRDTPWNRADRVGLYYKTSSNSKNKPAGSEVQVSSAFDFTYNGAYGNYNENGIWSEEPISFTPANNSASITRNRDNANLSLNWSSGKLYKIEDVAVTLNSGDKLTYFGNPETAPGTIDYNTWNRYTAIYDANNNLFVLYDDSWNPGGYVSTARTNSWEKRFWSNSLQADLLWSGSSSAATYKRRAVLSPSDTVVSGQQLALTCSDRSCLIDSGQNNLPITRAAWASSQNGQDDWSDPNSNLTATKYVFSGSAPSAPFEAMTLYWDADGDGALSTGDKPVRFDFRIDQLGVSERYVDFVGSASGAWDSSNDGYPSLWINLTDGTNEYFWSPGAHRWYHGISVYNGNSPVAIDKPVSVRVTGYSSAADLNYHAGNGMLMAAFNTNNYSDLPLITDPNLFGGQAPCQVPSDATAANAGYLNCGFPISYLASSTTYTFKYDGQRLQGLPNTQYYLDYRGSSQWTQTVNFKSGQELTNIENGDVYVLKNKAVSQTLLADLNQPTACSSSGLEFTSLSDIGMAITDLPSLTDTVNYPRPTQVWADKPEPDAGSCTVKQGVIFCD